MEFPDCVAGFVPSHLGSAKNLPNAAPPGFSSRGAPGLASTKAIKIRFWCKYHRATSASEVRSCLLVANKNGSSFVFADVMIHGT
jgi:hypothetical protein